ncbi:MAG: hypothetical protein Q8K52_06420 [Thiobacillus sp.]|nr:hypothetical protein [Thiobacillus sp.]
MEIMPRVEVRIGWMQGVARCQGCFLGKRHNTADADPGLNPKGQSAARTLLRCVLLV